jgi:hypothetical protein
MLNQFVRPSRACSAQRMNGRPRTVGLHSSASSMLSITASAATMPIWEISKRCFRGTGLATCLGRFILFRIDCATSQTKASAEKKHLYSVSLMKASTRKRGSMRCCAKLVNQQGLHREPGNEPGNATAPWHICLGLAPADFVVGSQYVPS